MKNWMKENAVIIIIIFIVSIFISWYMVSSIENDLIAEGIVTEKFRHPSGIWGYHSSYFLVIGEKDIQVNEETYYKYDVGDYYP